MLTLCLILSVIYYAQEYAGIIGWSLHRLYHDKISKPMKFEIANCFLQEVALNIVLICSKTIIILQIPRLTEYSPDSKQL